MSYTEAFERYGTERPDLRFALELQDLSEAVKHSQFRIFAETLRSGGAVKGINAKGCAGFPRSVIDELEQQAIALGAKGLIWIKIGKDGVESPIAKYLTAKELEQIKTKLEAEPADLLLLIAGERKLISEVLGSLRLEIARRGKLFSGGWRFLWVTDFPLFTWSKEEGRLVSEHHPFTAPKEEDLPLLEKEPEKVRAQAYDLVLNGIELGGGSIRIHKRDLQEKIFELLKIGPEEAEARFGFFLRALEYGTPPHGGIALGLDRLIMLMAGTQSIRDTIVFPKTNVASCPLTGAPMEVDRRQLEELGIEIKSKTERGKENS